MGGYSLRMFQRGEAATVRRGCAKGAWGRRPGRPRAFLEVALAMPARSTRARASDS
jgi:hypothetical protein